MYKTTSADLVYSAHVRAGSRRDLWTWLSEICEVLHLRLESSLKANIIAGSRLGKGG